MTWVGALGNEPAGGWVEAAAVCRGRMCRIASVCFCVAKNCWAKLSTVSLIRPTWEMGESRKLYFKLYLSVSLISMRLSHGWCSWTMSVAIA